MTSTQEFRIKTKIAIAGGNDELAREYAISLVRATKRERKNYAREREQVYRDSQSTLISIACGEAWIIGRRQSRAK